MADYYSEKHEKGKAKKCKKKSKTQSDSEDSGSNSDDSLEWVESVPKNAEKPKVNRDEWMSITSDFGRTISREQIQKRQESVEKKRDRLELDNPGQHERELNPYWRDGGSGLPSVSKPKEISTSNSSVGDGGFGWLKRAYDRAKEQAKEEGRSLEDVAAERWGSLEKLEKLLKEAENRTRGPSKRSFERERFYEDRRARHRERRHDRRHDDERKESRTFLKPTTDESDVVISRSDRWNRDRKPGWRIKSDEKNKNEDKKEIISPRVETVTVEPTKSNQDSVEETGGKLSDEEMNQLGAKLIKAELLGNVEVANKLRKRIEDAQKDRQTREEKTIIINKSSDRRNKRNKLTTTRDKEGKRTKYFADDDKYDLKEMFEREKKNTVEDENILFSKMVSKGKDLDGDVDYLGRLNQDCTQHGKAVKELKSSKVSESCRYCYGSESFSKHLVVATGTKVYVCIPNHVSLREGHCLIVPMYHASAATQLDEDVWEEIQDFRKALTKMFETCDEDVVFFENSRNLKSFPHTYLECVPLPRDAGDTAPIYFKKALLECETEWSHNKKVVDLSQKNVRKAVPKGLPYFAIDFGLQGGFAHVIEDEKLFPRNFAQEIIGGILDLDPRLWRKPPTESFDDQQSKRFDLIKRFKGFDWTKT